MVTRRFAGWGSLLAALGVTSCAALAGLDEDFRPAGEGGGGTSGSTTSATTASTSTGVGGGGVAGGTSGCVPAGVPDAPTGDDTGGDLSFVTAMRSIELDEKDLDVTLGLDLDGACSCLDEAPGTCTPIADLVCDGPGGIDNAVGRIFATIYELASGLFSSGQVSKAANDGKWTNLIRVSGYTGEPDDAKVEVKVYLTQGVNVGMPTPLWDGTDAWPVDDTSLMNPLDIESALVVADEAYVVGGVLVFRVAKEQLRLRSTLFQMNLDLSDVVVRAKLEAAAGGGYRLLDGVVAGHWPLTDVFGNLASIRYAAGSKLCTTDTDYTAVKEAVCGNADIRRAVGDGECDTLSFGAKFTAEPAQLGSIVAAEGPPSDACTPDTDPTTDSCD